MTTDTRLRLKAAARHANRLRWWSKARNLRRAGGSSVPSSFKDLSYVLWDPEIGDFSFDLDDLDAAAAFVGRVLDVEVARARHHLDEALSDPRLLADYADQRRPTLLRRRMSIGQRAVWWALIRLRQPALVVETGVWYGLGSLVVLRALEANAAEGGQDGRLMSFDIDPTAGWLVPGRLRTRWQLVHAATQDALAGSLAGRAVDLFVHDTPSDYALERSEFEVALEHAAPEAILLSGNGKNTPALADLAEARGLAHHHYGFRPQGHWFEGNGMSLILKP